MKEPTEVPTARARTAGAPTVPPTGAPTAPLLSIEDLHVSITAGERTVHALNGVGLDLRHGEALGIVGESGCGKTMTALAVLGLLPHGARVTGGRVRFDGRDLTSADPTTLRAVRGNTVGMVFQDPLTSLNPTLTIGAQVAEPLLLHKELSRKQAWRQAEEALGLVGLPRPAERMRAYPHQLSGGMRQRVALAMALVCEPSLLIADEPTTALDVTTQHQILELVDDLRQRLGMALVLVTHDLGVIARRVDKVAVMYAGRIVEQAGAHQLFTAPRHRYTQALFEALPERAAHRAAPLRTIPGLPPSLTVRTKGCPFAPRCTHASAECRGEEPELVPVGQAGQGGEQEHSHACFHPAVPLAGVGARTGEGAGVRTDTDGTAMEAEAEAEEVAEAEVDARTGRVAPAPVLLELDALHKEFPLAGGVFARRRGSVQAVGGVSLRLRRGETFGLVGESGCGKTTLGRIVAGLEEATSGEVRLEGRDLALLTRTERRAERRRIQLMFQDSTAAMDPRMRVGEILREPLAIHRYGTRGEQESRTAELLDAVGLPRGAKHRYPHEFSGGQRQRLGLARALALEPDLVIADEPVSALDVSVQAQILNLMRRLQRERSLTYLFISHDLSVVRYLADRVGVMYLGRLVESGPTEEVFARPLHPYTRALLGAGSAAAVPEPGAGTDTGTGLGPGTSTAGPATLRGEPPLGPAHATAPVSGCPFRPRCPKARDLCAEREPAQLGPGVDGHRAACHFPVEVEVEVEVGAEVEYKAEVAKGELPTHDK
ncbi:ABC transporter ATP-binding protein [Streptomyces sp. NA04227]|uniref:ABC transporter ATP-binding protein n=1 Tax=Streptomyces sp. NA04227 TaxID=2742136 RepID=UPI001590EE58|nr:ABC transporter ATP-binding protein [Streptomyces sp. NA04227]QKW06101.1 ABC transporter ATP-binding protein [Streptomyces sp. NA04227]